jgi:YesN/AraC family two-component response regulator
MARKKKQDEVQEIVYAPIIPQPITDTIEKNYANENFLMNAVAKGELQKINAIASAVFNNGTEERTLDTLRNRKNYLIILNTLLRKSAEKGGVHPLHIHHFSAEYAKKIENVRSIDESLKLQSEMIREYCLLVRQRSSAKYSFYVGKAVTLISYDLTADLSLKAVAEALQVNASYLSSLFSKECGCTLTEYVRGQRLEESLRLLATTEKTVLQIAVDCGFSDAHYFIRCFKQKTGITPLEYRRQNRK